MNSSPGSGGNVQRRAERKEGTYNNTHIQGKGETNVQEQLRKVLQKLRKKELCLRYFKKIVLSLAVSLEVRLMDFGVRQEESVISRLCLLLAVSYWAY